MTLDEYQKLSARTMPNNLPQPLLIWALGLVGEALEAVQAQSALHELPRPTMSTNNDKRLEARRALRAELGDVLWYAAAICTERHWDLGELASPGFSTPRKLLRSAAGVAEPIKKCFGHGKPLDEARVRGALWFVIRDVAFIGSKHLLTLDDICTVNVDKLRKRWPNGFQHADGGK